MEQVESRDFECLPADNSYGQCPAPCELAEVVELYFDRHRAPEMLAAATRIPNLGEYRQCRRLRLRPIRQVALERVFGPDRLPDPVGLDRAFVDAARDPVQVVGTLSKVGDQFLAGSPPEVHAGVDAQPFHARGGHRTNTVEFPDWQVLDKAVAHLLLPSHPALFEIPSDVCYLDGAAYSPSPHQVRAAGECCSDRLGVLRVSPHV